VQKTMGFIKRKKFSLAVIILLVFLILYFLIPRKLSGLCLDSKSSLTSVSVWGVPDGAEKESHEYIISEQADLKKFNDLLNTCYVRPKIFNAEYVNEGYEGYYFFFKENASPNNKTVFLFTSDIISVNGRQFVLYNHDFSEKLKKILNEKLETQTIID